MLSFPITGSYTDLYEITMGEVYFLEDRVTIPAVFDYFFRKIPFNGGYVVFAGLDTVLDALTDLRFTEEDIRFLKEQHVDHRYLDFLERFEFHGTIWSAAEGEVIFPNCPILRVEGTLFETQLVETVLLNFLNFESLIATKASRMREVAGSRILSDFGLRRAHGPGAILAARAAIIGGFDNTSNVAAAQRFGIKAVGTMAHSFVESYGSELEAFRAFARSSPDNCTFLVDTYDTLNSGIPNAITVAKEMETQGRHAAGVRLDSGDLAWLARATRRLLDEAGLPYLKIVASNQLNEHVIRSLLDQGAPIDIFGVGTHLVTGQPDAALDGVYKLAVSDGQPRLKLSETLQKTTLPGAKTILRLIDSRGLFAGADVVLLTGDPKPDRMFHPFEPDRSLTIAGLQQEPLMQKVMENGKRLTPARSLTDIAAFAAARRALLPAEYRRFENPHTYKVGVSKRLLDLRDEGRKQHQQPNR